MLLNDSDQAATVVAETLRHTSESSLYQTFGLNKNGIAHYIFTRKSPMAIADTAKDSRLGDLSQVLNRLNIRSMLVLPLLIEGSVIGGLFLCADTPRVFTADEVTLAWRVADQSASALARDRLAQRHRRLATAIEQTADSVIIADTSGKTVYVNPAFEKTSGYQLAEVTHFLEQPALRGSDWAAVWEALQAAWFGTGGWLTAKKTAVSIRWMPPSARCGMKTGWWSTMSVSNGILPAN
jgi:PAS domain-containing protein